jgi:AraC-like DNA-binding protein
MWKPISPDAMMHIISQTGHTGPLPRGSVEAVAQRFWVPDSSVFHFAAKRRTIGQTTVMLSTLSPFHFTGVRAAPSGFLHIGFVLNGSVSMASGGDRSEIFSSASVYALPSWESATLKATTMTRGLDIQIPAARLDERGVRARSRRLKIDGAVSVGTPLRVFALAVVDSAWNPSDVASLATERAIEDLVVGLLLECEDYAMDSEDLRAGLRARASSLIAANHGDAELRPAGVARQLGVSLRHLQRSFEGTGTSVALQIRRNRAEYAAMLLSGRSAAILTMAEIAERAGFASTFELRAAFKSRFGTLPSQFRAESAEHTRNIVPQTE